MNARDIWILYTMELRSALRERAIVVNSILMPIFLYPILLWVMFSAMVFVRGLNEDFTSRIALAGQPSAGHEVFLDSLRAEEKVDLTTTVDDDDALRRVREGDLDALLSFRDVEQENAALPGNFRVRIHFDASEARSRTARERIQEELDAYRSRWIRQSAEELGLSEADQLVFALDDENVSSEEEQGALLLGMMIPLFLAIMVALGCFYPAVDTTAGERERSTWETLMTTSASRISVVTAKYLYVATMGVFAGILNVLAIFVSLGAVLAPLASEIGSVSYRLPLLAVPVMIFGAATLALMLSVAMMILASFARSFKDGQAMVQPVYFIAVLIPILLGQQSDETLNAGVAAIPVANVTMMIRDAINGIFSWPLILEAMIVNLLVVALGLWIARIILGFEDFLIGTFDGSFWRFAKDRMVPGSSRRESA